MTKRPLKCLTQQPWVEIFCFSPLALLSSTRWIVQSPLFVSSLHTFSVEVAEQPPNKRRWNSSFLVNRWKLMLSFRYLSTLLPPKAQQKTVFSVAVQLGWPCHARCPLDRRVFERPWNCQDNKLVGRQTRRVDVFYRNLPHTRNSESRFTPTTSVEVFVRSATDQRK